VKISVQNTLQKAALMPRNAILQKIWRFSEKSFHYFVCSTKLRGSLMQVSVGNHYH